MTQDQERVLILSASYGAGHHQVSHAIREAIAQRRPSCEVRIVDFFDFVSPTFNRLTQFSYVQSVKHWPTGYGLFYRVTGGIPTDSWFQRRLNTMGAQQLLDEIQAFGPDAVVCTYPTPAGVMSEMRADGRIRVPVLGVVTDFVVHSQWIHPHVDHYFASCDEVADGMAERGMDRRRVTVTGIPIGATFSRRHDPEKARRAQGLRPDLPAVLVMAGAFAMLRGLSDVIRVLSGLKTPHQTFVVAGHDARLAARLRRTAAGSRSRYPVTVSGYVDDIAGLMSAADVLVTKAGGITVSEALACQLPMVIYRQIPGQEEANTAYLTGHGTAFLARNPVELAPLVERLLADAELRSAMRASARKLARPDAAERVADAVLDACARARSNVGVMT